MTGLGSPNLWRCGLQAFFLLRPGPISAQTPCLCHHLLVEGGSVLQSTEAELSYGVKPPHAALPKGLMGLQHLGVISQGCWRGITLTMWHCVERQGSARVLLPVGALQAAKPLSTFRERCRTKPLKCQPEGHPTGGISPCQGCVWAFRDTHPPGHQGLCTSPRHRCWQNPDTGTSHGPTSASPLTPELFAFGVSTRDGSDHVAWGSSCAPLGSARLAPCPER